MFFPQEFYGMGKYYKNMLGSLLKNKFTRKIINFNKFYNEVLFRRSNIGADTKLKKL